MPLPDMETSRYSTPFRLEDSALVLFTSVVGRHDWHLDSCALWVLGPTCPSSPTS